ncbi:hypothetical protein BDV95DRAFT_577397 [Massariosphaeria phaeospora]|uniref:Uncharacterized protein n=1 Tax=Massariosphaeria phaeospora TaxID=100035 RepID=A0A7C8I4X4_9PLEO|nr:hypothetical protein BDV95DRAFT_577397 [Massariosphaeria phaeospora]
MVVTSSVFRTRQDMSALSNPRSPPFDSALPSLSLGPAFVSAPVVSAPFCCA